MQQYNYDLAIERLNKLQRQLLRKKKSDLVNSLNQFIISNGNQVPQVSYNTTATKADIVNALIGYYSQSY